MIGCEGEQIHERELSHVVNPQGLVTGRIYEPLSLWLVLVVDEYRRVRHNVVRALYSEVVHEILPGSKFAECVPWTADSALSQRECGQKKQEIHGQMKQASVHICAGLCFRILCCAILLLFCETYKGLASKVGCHSKNDCPRRGTCQGQDSSVPAGAINETKGLMKDTT
jgi:hypothetical protein